MYVRLEHKLTVGHVKHFLILGLTYRQESEPKCTTTKYVRTASNV